MPHLWDLLDAPRLSLTQIRARLREGWALRALAAEQHYVSAGAAGCYSHVLLGPNGELAQLTDRVFAQLEGVECAAELRLDTSTVTLSVPFAEKDEAKALGARWDAGARTWVTRPGHTEAFARWLA